MLIFFGLSFLRSEGLSGKPWGEVDFQLMMQSFHFPFKTSYTWTVIPKRARPDSNAPLPYDRIFVSVSPIPKKEGGPEWLRHEVFKMGENFQNDQWIVGRYIIATNLNTEENPEKFIIKDTKGLGDHFRFEESFFADILWLSFPDFKERVLWGSKNALYFEEKKVSTQSEGEPVNSGDKERETVAFSEAFVRHCWVDAESLLPLKSEDENWILEYQDFKELKEKLVLGKERRDFLINYIKEVETIRRKYDRKFDPSQIVLDIPE